MGNAVSIKKKINDNLENIVDTMAFFFGEKYSDFLHKKIMNCVFYVYDDFVIQKERLIKIDLKGFAKQFSSEVIEDLDLKEDRKKEIVDSLADLMLSTNVINYSDKDIRKILCGIDELKKDVDSYKRKFDTCLHYFNDYYEVKDIYKLLDRVETVEKKNALDITKKEYEILNDYFNINHLDSNQITELWDSILAYLSFENSNNKNAINSLKMDIYSLLGCKGKNIEELEEDAIDRDIDISFNVLNKIKNKRDNYIKNTINPRLVKFNNMDSIINSLESKDINLDSNCENYLRSYVTNYKVQGGNYVSNDSDNHVLSFIIYSNTVNLYNSFDGADIIIHEFIHYLGGINPNIGKNGLMYQESDDGIHLEEAYVNYVSKNITKEYLKEYDAIIGAENVDICASKYDVTYSYMEMIFDLYGEKLKQLHICNYISYKDAKKMIPYDLISKSISRIVYESDLSKIDRIINEEKNKLIKFRNK